MSEERRQHERQDVEFILKYKTHNSSDNFEYAYYQNISLGGILIIEIDKELAHNTTIDIELSMPYTPDTALMNSLQISGKVVYCVKNREKVKKFDCGIEFIDLSSEKKKILDKFLKYIEK
jgi:c-di-GMP-binding flagellar brake protein YcgR